MKEIVQLLIPLWSANVLVNLFYFFRKKCAIPDYPLDGNRLWFDGRYILGPAKTLLGLPITLLGGYVGGMLIQSNNGLVLGLSVYLGAILSGFIKRRFGLKRGEPLYIVDQTDYLFAAYILFMLSGERTNNLTFLSALSITIPVHFITNKIAYHLKVRDTKW
jgi:CDP-2,3-bis-(O-geranylgeranyl)-sn-glycerol synthase